MTFSLAMFCCVARSLNKYQRDAGASEQGVLLDTFSVPMRTTEQGWIELSDGSLHSDPGTVIEQIEELITTW